MLVPPPGGGWVALGGREAWRRGNADGLGAREGGNYSPLRHVPPSALPRADSLFPHSPAPARYDSMNRVDIGSVAGSAGRLVVREPRRRRASYGKQVFFLIFIIIEIIMLFVIIYILAIIVIIGVVIEGTR